jgi:Cu(I)/Ag(I) efflux system membrane protein CusA/SilA
VCAVFLFHLRSSLVTVVSLPVGILIAYIIMHLQGINANIMSLGGIAITMGAMVDGAIVMSENLHKHMEETPLTDESRWQVVAKASIEVGPALFFSLLINTMSFLPVFTFEAQERRMSSPLAFTKTYAMAASEILAITLVPVLMERLSYLIPLTFAIIVLLLYLYFRRFTEVLIILATLPVAALGGVWLMIALGYNFLIALEVGFIALAGVAVEIGIIMLVYLNQVQWSL